MSRIAASRLSGACPFVVLILLFACLPVEAQDVPQIEPDPTDLDEFVDADAPCYGGGEGFGDPTCGHACSVNWLDVPRHGPIEFHGEYLLWWTRGSRVPPLVTTSPAGTPRAQAGVLGQDTTVLFGDEGLTDGVRLGGRFTLNYWFEPEACTGLEVSYTVVGEEMTSFGARSQGDPILARPYFNVNTDVQDARLIAFSNPNVVEGAVAVNATTEFQSFEVLLRRMLTQDCNVRLEGLIGWRFNRLSDHLRIDESTVSTDSGGIVPVGTAFDLFDRFDTMNRFHGAEIGLLLEERRCNWTLDTSVKVAFGNTHSSVRIDGSTTTTVPGVAPVTSRGGLLALPTNIGLYEENRFSVVPEFGITLGYDVTCQLRATFGYTLIYWSNVARPGDQIDFGVNNSQFSGGALSGEARPEFNWATAGYWAQGMNVGLEYCF